MRKLRILIPVMIMVSCSASAKPAKQNPKVNWNAVEHLRAGTAISVMDDQRSRLLCYFTRASGDQLICETLPHRSGFPIPVPVPSYSAVFQREEIREVRLEHNAGTNTLIGAGIGAGLGAAFVARLDRGAGPKGGVIAFGSLVGALIGATAGHDAPLFHRKVVYRR